jgi:chemotaxis protein methyltransferase CheR
MEVTLEDVKSIATTLKEYTKYDLTEYSEKSLKRRIERITTEYKMNPVYIIYKIKNDPEFARKLVNDITVNTTELFRDPPMWYSLRYDIYPKLQNHAKISIWHAGCSTGQEVYSNIILMNELGILHKAIIFATDLNDEAIEKAQKGEYRYRINFEYLDNFDLVINKHPLNYEINRGVDYKKYFEIDRKRDILKIKDQYRKIPMFRVHDLINGEQEFLTKFDIIFCRNVLIYFNFNLQKRILKMFRKNMKKGSYLILGYHESIIEPMELGFEKKSNYYVAV